MTICNDRYNKHVITDRCQQLPKPDWKGKSNHKLLPEYGVNDLKNATWRWREHTCQWHWFHSRIAIGNCDHAFTLGCVRKTFFGPNFSLVRIIICFGANMPQKFLTPSVNIDRRGQNFFWGILAPNRMITPTKLKLGPKKVFLTHPILLARGLVQAWGFLAPRSLMVDPYFQRYELFSSHLSLCIVTDRQTDRKQCIRAHRA